MAPARPVTRESAAFDVPSYAGVNVAGPRYEMFLGVEISNASAAAADPPYQDWVTVA
jgi:hypothetical protein